METIARHLPVSVCPANTSTNKQQIQSKHKQ